MTTGEILGRLADHIATAQSFLYCTYECAKQGELLGWIRYWIVGS